ncbi:MAG: cysteine synthase family protein [Candidatus Pseudobacter hemicellulosilyticus]|uniref:Cysteine synthase family protein n=1 Tax=Candidatus Pseudobacter hemicellulosilyticus TaxID=3121375 RepID=A0AAJ5X0N0_9BACT|nr:MAG: cysteine synthase family protein [Pseudobacter sp.]
MSSITTAPIDPRLADNIRLLGRKVGKTPLHRITRLFSKPGVQVYAKKEWQQLSGSVKARAGYNIFRAAIEKGILTPDKALLDATSGNTGIAYASIGHQLKLRVTLCLPENASRERKEILQSLGAEIIYTSRFEGTDGAQALARELAEKHPGRYYYADQYKNENNWKAHYHTTAPEILEALPETTHFVAALGTTGTFVGTGRRLKALNPHIHLTSLQPDNPLHGLEGWKHLETAVVPGIYDGTVADDNLEIGTEEAYELIRAAYKYEGLLLSPSSAANLAGALRVADKLDSGTVVTILPDNADKYSEVIHKLHIL